MNQFPTVTATGIDGSPALELLIDALRDKHGAGVNAVIMYGSCLRSGDIFDGLLDLYLVCDNYRGVYEGRIPALANWLIPPNVFYSEVEYEGKTLRSKYAVLSTADFQSGCSGDRFESYIWARFAQPVSIAWCRDPQTENMLEASLPRAVTTFLERCLPRLPASGTVATLWTGSLALSYATELRSERSGRSGQLAQASLAHFVEVSRLAADAMAYPFSVYEQERKWRYQAQVPAFRRRTAGLAWLSRRTLGKLMSILRLLKALFTFAGGLDYIAWKLQRHSGQEIVIPPRVRQYPLLFVWGFCWRLYRRGVFK